VTIAIRFQGIKEVKEKENDFAGLRFVGAN